MTTVFEQHHIEVERHGDDFILRQIDHSGNTEAVALHISQIRYLAEVAGLLPASAVPVLSPVPAAEGHAMHATPVAGVKDSSVSPKAERNALMKAAVEAVPEEIKETQP